MTDRPTPEDSVYELSMKAMQLHREAVAAGQAACDATPADAAIANAAADAAFDAAIAADAVADAAAAADLDGALDACMIAVRACMTTPPDGAKLQMNPTLK